MLKRFLIIFYFLALPSFASDKLNYINPDFWKIFGDDYLYCYIIQTIENNHDLKKAGFKVEEYRQKTRKSLGKELPSIMTAPAYLGAQIPNIRLFQFDTNAFILPFLVNYEADFLLKNRDKTKAEKKNYEIQKIYEQATYISLVSDLATIYLNLIKNDELIKIEEKIVSNDIEILKKNELRFNNGISTLNEVNNSRKKLIDTQNNIVELEKNNCNLLYQLAVLIGNSPDCIEDLNRGNLKDFAKNYTPPESISSDIIFSRPDVLMSEKKLEKAKIDIRIAKKEFFPRFQITGIWIFNTISHGTFFSWENSIVSLLANAVTDLYAGGRKIANLKMKKAIYEQLFEEYKQTDLIALKEVNTSLCLIKNDNENYLNILEKNKNENSNFKLTKLKFAEGTVSKIDILESENKVLEIEKSRIIRRCNYLMDIITLYKSVGAKL